MDHIYRGKSRFTTQKSIVSWKQILAIHGSGKYPLPHTIDSYELNSADHLVNTFNSCLYISCNLLNFFLGFFCATPGLANYTGPCANGSYCPTNSTISTPYDCPKGFHCPQGSPRPKPCPAGQFTNSTSTSECVVCPPGYFCLPLTWSGAVKNDSKGYEICSAGFYCPEGTGSDLRPCKAGMHGSLETFT
jgi:hypothetical protein